MTLRKKRSGKPGLEPVSEEEIRQADIVAAAKSGRKYVKRLEPGRMSGNEATARAMLLRYRGLSSEDIAIALVEAGMTATKFAMGVMHTIANAESDRTKARLFELIFKIVQHNEAQGQIGDEDDFASLSDEELVLKMAEFEKMSGVSIKEAMNAERAVPALKKTRAKVIGGSREALTRNRKALPPASR